MIAIVRAVAWPLRILLALFALYAVWTIPSLLPRWGASPAGFGILIGWLALAALAWPLAQGRPITRNTGILMSTAVITLRLLTLGMSWGHAPAGDPMVYVGLAGDLLAGRGLSFTDPFTHVTFHALYPPLYPVLLACVGALFGLGPVTLWTGNLICDGVAAWLIVRIGTEAGSRPAGLAAAWLYLIWPTFILATPFAQKEPLVTLLALALAFRLLRLRSRPPAARDGAWFGILAGLLALTQPGLLTVPAMLCLLLMPVVGFRSLFLLALRSIPVFLLVMAPWWIRNGFMLGHFVPLTSTGGIGLWIGNNPQASGNWMRLPPEIAHLPELEQSARAAAVARQWILAHPIDMLRLSLTKLVRTFGVEQFTLLRWNLLRPALPAGIAPALFPLLQGALVAALAATVAAMGRTMRRRGGDIALLLLAAVFAQLLLFDLWFEFAERHRYVAMPFLFLVIAVALTHRTHRRG